MYNHRIAITDSNLYARIQCECKIIDDFLCRNIRRHPARLLGISKAQYKILIHSPTPTFFEILYNLYLSIKRDVYFTLYYEFKQSIKYEMPCTNITKKRNNK